MRKEIFIGIFVSAVLHAGFLFGEMLLPESKPAAVVVQEEEEIIQMELPPLEPEPEETVEEIVEEQVVNQLAPPSLVDMPTVVPVDAFVQQIQPPPPPGLEVSKGAVSIPVTRPGTNFGKGMKDLFDIRDLDQSIVPRVRVPANYPFELKRNGIEGWARVRFIVTTTGDVIDAYATGSSHREFEQPAIEAVMRWKFRPGKKGGRNVNVRAEQEITFTIKENE